MALRSSPEIAPQTLEELQEAAERGRSMHYAPYSGFLVLAAVQSISGGVFGGSNVEVANYSLSKHAEETAVLAALAAGQSPRTGWMSVLYVAGAAPCGSCRQFAYEFAGEDAICVVQDVGQPMLHDRPLAELASPKLEVWRLEDLLPRAFGPADVLGDPDSRCQE